MRAGGALAKKNAYANGFRSGFLQSFNLAETDERGKLVAFTNDALSGGCAMLHRAADNVLGKTLQVSFGVGFESSFRHKNVVGRWSLVVGKTRINSPQRHGENKR